MDKTIFKYLEFLLPIHNCVTIPEFGGFIINVEPAVFDAKGNLVPPKYYIVFNPDLDHNDGILASHIIKDDNVSYNAACNKIKAFAKSLKSDLKSEKVVPCGNMGILKSDDTGNITFIQNKDFVYPAFFGLYPTNIKLISELNRTHRQERRNVSLKYALSGVAAAAAAIFLFIVPTNNIQDNTYTQKSDFISSITSSLSVGKTNSKIVECMDSCQNITIADIKQEVPAPTRKYYIIIGGEDSKSRAEILLSKAIQAGFSKAAIVQNNDRYRIYVSSFDDKTEAENFLDTFRKENPAYDTAWLHSQRN